MISECRHILASGKKCQAFAVTNSSFCFFHRNQRERRDTAVRPGTPFILPTLEDAHSALNAVNDVFRAMGEGRLKRAEAGTYLYGIQIAARLIVRIDQTTIKPVRNLCYDNYGTELAELKTICEPPEDCLQCTRRETCDDFEDYEEEVEELEQQLAEQQQAKDEQGEGQNDVVGKDQQTEDKTTSNEQDSEKENKSILKQLQANAPECPDPVTKPISCHPARTGSPSVLSNGFLEERFCSLGRSLGVVSGALHSGSTFHPLSS